VGAFTERLLDIFVYVPYVVAAILESRERWDERTKALEGEGRGKGKGVKKNACPNQLNPPNYLRLIIFPALFIIDPLVTHCDVLSEDLETEYEHVLLLSSFKSSKRGRVK